MRYEMRWRRRMPLIMQTESAECGLACLAMVLDHFGQRCDLASLRNRFSPSSQGMRLNELLACAEACELQGRALRLEMDQLRQLSCPAILHWDNQHFVVLVKVSRRGIVIHDPAAGRTTQSWAAVNRHFTGIALALTPRPTFAPQDQRRDIGLRQLLGQCHGLIPALARIFCFACVLEVFALGAPLLNQMVIDDVLVARDSSLLTLITLALLLLVAVQTLLGLLRQWAILSLSLSLNVQWSQNVFHHLLRLPIAWYEKRDTGGISARFDAVNTLQSTLTNTLLSALLDALLVLTLLAMMMSYSIKLSAIALVSALLYFLLRLVAYRPFRQATEQSWQAATRENSHFLETLQGVLSLRINAAMSARESAWLQLNIARRNAELAEQKLSMLFGVIEIALLSLSAALVLWLGATEVLEDRFTVGMLVAWLSFQGRFSSSISNLTDSLFSWLQVGVYRERLADIVLTPLEAAANLRPEPLVTSSAHVIEAHQLRFRYHPNAPWLLDNATFTLGANEIVAITGPSGCGKTTLAKLLLGLHPLESGEIILLGQRLNAQHCANVRQNVGCVLQEDRLFSGSILENITLFSQPADREWAQHCASQAQIDDHIQRLPMGYQTLLGELGGALSGGQRQRLLLARALYKRPRLLILDEATSQLDSENERLIANVLRDLHLPVLLIAHRPETLASADRVLILQQGQLLPWVNTDTP